MDVPAADPAVAVAPPEAAVVPVWTPVAPVCTPVAPVCTPVTPAVPVCTLVALVWAPEAAVVTPLSSSESSSEQSPSSESVPSVPVVVLYHPNQHFENSKFGKSSPIGTSAIARPSPSGRRSNAGVLHQCVQLHSIRHGPIRLRRARPSGVHLLQAKGNVPCLVATKLRKVGARELTVEQPVKLRVLGGALTVRDLKRIRLEAQVFKMCSNDAKDGNIQHFGVAGQRVGRV